MKENDIQLDDIDKRLLKELLPYSKSGVSRAALSRAADIGSSSTIQKRLKKLEKFKLVSIIKKKRGLRYEFEIDLTKRGHTFARNLGEVL